MTPIIDPNFWLNMAQKKLEQPDIVGQILAQYQRPGDPSAQNYDPRYVSELVNNPAAAPLDPTQPVATSNDYDLNAGYLKGSPGDLAVKAGKIPPYTTFTEAAKQNKSNATPPPAAQPSTQSSLPTGYEEYMKIFKNTLPAEPELDKKKRNQLATVAAINALGQMIRQVVDYHYGAKHGSPINPEPNVTTQQLLAQYEKEHDEYQQRKDRYDLMKTNTMQNAFKYAYGDEQYQRKYNDTLAMMNQRATNAEELQKNKAGYNAALMGAKHELGDETMKDKQANDLEKMKKKYGYDLDLLGKRIGAENARAADKVVTDQFKLAGDNVPVVDQQTHATLTIPKELYFDVYQKIMNHPTAEISKRMKDLVGANYEQSKQIVDGMIASEYQKYYKPIYDATGKFQSWEALPEVMTDLTNPSFLPKTSDQQNANTTSGEQKEESDVPWYQR
jgi:hypothetical protein